MFSDIFFVFVLFCFGNSSIMGISSDDWSQIDPNYDLSYLKPVGNAFDDTFIGCARASLRENVIAFAYKRSGGRCQLYTVDYYKEHIWVAESGFKFYQRKEESYKPDDCLDQSCGFCMPILETRMTILEAYIACSSIEHTEDSEESDYWLLEMEPASIHRCVVMQLQYLRKPTSNRYWVGHTRVPGTGNCMDHQFRLVFGGKESQTTLLQRDVYCSFLEKTTPCIQPIV